MMRKIGNYIFALLIGCLGLSACTSVPAEVRQTNVVAPLYPDYTDVTIPVNIAPLNFLLRDADVEAVCLKVNDEVLFCGSGAKIDIDIDDWKALLERNQGKEMRVQVMAEKAGEWIGYKDFKWNVVADKLDPYLTYRLIEPDYEVFHNLQIQERCVENFDVRNISDYKEVGDKCMNCHTYGNQSPDLSMFYVRGEGGGAVLNRGGKLSKMNIKTEDMASGSVYFGFDPTGRYITFSTNVILPTFHRDANKRMEVVDKMSDVYALDLEQNAVLRSPLLEDSTRFETFPTFSPDGKYVYFCSSPRILNSNELKQLQYSLCRIPFNDGHFGTEVDTVYSATAQGHSVCHPRVSPDGQYLLFTIADYGTFPIWHREADQAMMDLRSGAMIDLSVVNSGESDTYHSWSSNSRWFVFASKRDDGLYGKPYFAYVDKQGRAHKPFVLPQQDPSLYDNILKSFNAPEMGKGVLPFTISDVVEALKGEPINVR